MAYIVLVYLKRNSSITAARCGCTFIGSSRHVLS